MMDLANRRLATLPTTVQRRRVERIVARFRAGRDCLPCYTETEQRAVDEALLMVELSGVLDDDGARALLRVAARRWPKIVHSARRPDPTLFEGGKRDG